MDFLDRAAIYIGNLLAERQAKPKKSKNKVKKESPKKSLPVVVPPQEEKKRATPIPKDILTPRASFAEVNYTAVSKVVNDDFKGKSYYASNREELLQKDVSVVLPFAGGKRTVDDWAELAYRNRFGLFITMGSYIAIMIIMSVVTFTQVKSNVSEGILLDVRDMEELAIQLEEIRKDAAKEKDSGVGDIDNAVSDGNSDVAEDYINYDTNSQMESGEMFDEWLDGLMQQRQNMRNYESTMRQIDIDSERELKEAARERERLEEERRANEYSKKTGNVTVAFDLVGRRALFLEMPAYLCRGGGRVIVNISVSRRGEVVSAKVKQSVGVTDNCLLEMAVWAAKNSRFDLNEAAEYRQRGTITYTFVAQ